ncbi:S8 family serine peptidase, partial [Pseudomonadota bacterium]
RLSPSAADFHGKVSTFNPDTAYEQGEVIINDPPQGYEDKLRASGFRVTEFKRMTSLDMTVVRVATPARMSVADAIKKLAIILPGVNIAPNHQYDPSGIALNLKNANPRAVAGWESLSPTCGRGLVLGQVDSGVDMNHPALKGQDITYRNFPKTGRKPAAPSHGTSVAAMLVGTAEWGGLLPGAKLYAANMFEVNEKGKTVGSSMALIKGLDWLMGKGINAINLSIAGSDNKVVRKAFEAARRKNIILIAAVGNWGRADKPAFPAAYNHVVAVTATKGPELIYKHANSGKYVDFAAPGVGIYTALPGGGGKLQSGTSFATPYITAMAAVLVKAGKTPDADTLRRLLGPRTRDLGKPGKDTVFGFGALTLRPACH